MIIAMSLTNGTLIAIVKDADNTVKNLTACSDHPKWTEIREAYKAQNHTRILTLLSMSAVVEEYTVGQLSVNSTGVTYAGRPLHTVDSNRVIAFLREGLPYQPIANYISRKMANPSSRAITELYQFLEHKSMPITPEGFIIAYKGVQPDFYSIHGNTSTIVLQGTVNESGQILNEIGKVIEVQRNCVSDDFRSHCAAGLHAGSLSYAKGFGSRVVLVSIDPADVVSVPNDCDCQKLRCCKYTVVGEYTGPMPSTLTTEFSPASDDGEDAECPHCGMDTCEGECQDPEENAMGGYVPPSPHENEQADAVSAKEKVIDTPSPAVFITDNLVAPEVFEVLKEQLGITWELKLTTPILDLGIDSLDAVELVMAFEELLGIDIPDMELENFEVHAGNRTIGDIVNYIRSVTVVTKADPSLKETYDEQYMKGMTQGVCDRAAGDTAKYLGGDQLGADSPQHAMYIDGYVAGFA